MRKIAFVLILMIAFDAVPCKNLASFATTIATITSDNEKALLDAVAKLNKSGGVIYINTPIVRISSTKTINLSGSIAGGIVGQQQSGGTYPVIDFKNARNNGSTARGFTISGSNQYMKYLIIQNSGDNGIWVSGSKNTLDHIITRYNGDSGIQLSDNAVSNTLNYCYSYRNIDVPTFGANADGFAPKLGASKTVFNYCFAWDNSDDGWDSYDKEGDNSATVSYLHSACWNNGNPQVFTGKYDYDNRWALDKNMRTIQYLMSSDKNFESNFNNRRFAISSNAKINGIKYADWMAKAEGEMNGNGFKFGSKTTQKSASVKELLITVLLLITNQKVSITTIVKNALDILLTVLHSKTTLTINYHILLLNGQITGVGIQLNHTNPDKAKHLELLKIQLPLLKLLMLLEIKSSATAELINSPIVSTLTM